MSYVAYITEVGTAYLEGPDGGPESKAPIATATIHLDGVALGRARFVMAWCPARGCVWPCGSTRLVTPPVSQYDRAMETHIFAGRRMLAKRKIQDAVGRAWTERELEGQVGS